MRKVRLILYCVIFMFICQPLTGVRAVSDGQEAAIMNHCDTIKDSLKKVQKDDARTRVYLGGRYEAILTRFITPLNVKLVEGNLSSAELVENQNKFAETKGVFASDFVSYQKDLEELVGMNCKAEPVKFYDKLVVVRKKRKVVEQDVVKMRGLISEQVKLVTELMGKL